MQPATALFLAWILSAFSMLSIAAPAFSATENMAQPCMIPTISQENSKANSHDCCQQLESHCATGQCDCDTGHSSNPLVNTVSIIPLSFHQQPTLKQALSSGFISHPSTSLYRPPRING